MRFLSVCSGIEAASVAWHSLGWSAAAYSEIEPFPSAVLAHHYPSVYNLGNMTKYMEWDSERIGSIDVLVGGTPCQSFSVAGLRAGLADPRGNLMLVYLAIAAKYRPRWLVWENVPGVLSTNGGRDFGTFLGALGQLGYGFGYRILDAQYVRVESHPWAVPQRRRRVFVVGYFNDWRRAAAVLFECESLCWNPAPSRSAGKGVAGTLNARTGRSVGADDAANGHIIAMPHSNVSPALKARDSIGFESNMSFSLPSTDGFFQTLTRRTHASVMCPTNMSVRRLTPVECERLQGFSDGYTAIQWRGKSASVCPDGLRYKAIGNSMAVPVMNWIGKRIAHVETEK